MVKIYHIPRDYSKTLDQQKRELKYEYKDFQYLYTDQALGGEPKIHFMAEEKKDEV